MKAWMNDWKSTVTGILLFLIATFAVVTAFLAPYVLMAPSSGQALIAKIAAGVVLATALAQAYLKLITNNADAAAVAQALSATPGSSAATPTAATLATTPLIPVAKVLALLLIFGSGAMLLAGCATATAPPPPLAPGYINSADQNMGQILSGARTFYSTIQCEEKALNWSQAAALCVTDPNITSPMILSATEKSAFKDLGVSLNTANLIYLDYHNGTTTEAAAQAAINAVQQKQSALPALAVTN